MAVNPRRVASARNRKSHSSKGRPRSHRRLLGPISFMSALFDNLTKYKVSTDSGDEYFDQLQPANIRAMQATAAPAMAISPAQLEAPAYSLAPGTYAPEGGTPQDITVRFENGRPAGGPTQFLPPEVRTPQTPIRPRFGDVGGYDQFGNVRPASRGLTKGGKVVQVLLGLTQGGIDALAAGPPPRRGSSFGQGIRGAQVLPIERRQQGMNELLLAQQMADMPLRRAQTVSQIRENEAQREYYGARTKDLLTPKPPQVEGGLSTGVFTYDPENPTAINILREPPAPKASAPTRWSLLFDAAGGDPKKALELDEQIQARLRRVSAAAAQKAAKEDGLSAGQKRLLEADVAYSTTKRLLGSTIQARAEQIANYGAAPGDRQIAALDAEIERLTASLGARRNELLPSKDKGLLLLPSHSGGKKKLTEAVVADYLAKHGNDPAKARAAAIRDGYEVKEQSGR